MAETMNFPNDWAEFLEDYSFRDHKEFYTNGARLIPTFRVKQMMEHYLRKAVTDNNVGSKWIPVSERLPDKPGRYIICEELGRVMIAGWDTSCWFGGHSYSEFTVYKATHWMPLPEPPKGE